MKIRERLDAEGASSPASRIRTRWQHYRPLLGERPEQVGFLAAASVATGLAEAAMMALVAQAALLIATGPAESTIQLGPFTFTSSAPRLLLAAVVFAVIRLLLQFVLAWLPAQSAAHLQARVRTDLFDAFLRASWKVQAADREGELQELMSGHVGKVTYAAILLSGAIAALITFLTLLGSAFLLAPVLAMAVLGAAIALFLLLRPFSYLERRQSSQVSGRSVDLAASVSETVRLAEETHAFGVGTELGHRFKDAVESVRRPFLRSQFIGRAVPGVYQSVVFLLVIAGLSVLLVLGSQQIATLGAVVLIVIRAMTYGQQLQAAQLSLNEMLPFWERMTRTLKRYKASATHEGKAPLESICDIRLVNVGFGYDPARPVLRNLDLELQAGEILGIVGPSGVGKSTLLHVLLRLFDPDSGEYLINGYPSAQYRYDDLRRLVSYVPQVPKLIEGTIADNIRFFRIIEDSQVIKAAHLAHIHEEIMARPGGYEAQIGPRANTLSGGQTQRLCLARALAGKPQLLVLDEPTSALDSLSETLIRQSLHELRGQMTTIVVAHQNALLEVCDRVLQLNGQIGEPEFAQTITMEGEGFGGHAR